MVDLPTTLNEVEFKNSFNQILLEAHDNIKKMTKFYEADPPRKRAEN